MERAQIEDEDGAMIAEAMLDALRRRALHMTRAVIARGGGMKRIL